MFGSLVKAMANKDIAVSKIEQEVERSVLSLKVQLSDGSNGFIFTRNPQRSEAKMFTYNCHICSVPNLPGERCLYTHISGRRHQTKLTLKPFDVNQFRAPMQRNTKIAMQIAPGEPVPPGFENEVKPVAELQAKIDKCRMPMVGLEYLLELTLGDNKEPGYLCVLCEKRGDPRTIIDHITSYKHRLKYLEKHFPTAAREISQYRYNRERDFRDVLPQVIQTICEAIEEAYGRLAPSVFENEAYEKNRMACLQEVINDKHLSEKMGSTFVQVINHADIMESIKGNKVDPLAAKKRDTSATDGEANKRRRLSRDRRRSLDSISSISSSSLDAHDLKSASYQRRAPSKDDDVIFIKSESRSPTFGHNRRRKSRSRSKSDRYASSKNRSRSRSRSRISPKRKSSPKSSRQVLPTPRELSMQATAIGEEGYKWEKYRCMVELAVKELDKVQKEHDKNPENHPMYPEEWKLFWNRRYKELLAEKKDPTKYDFKPEWIEFWTKRMQELHDEAIEKKKEEIRKKLNLPKDGKEKTGELKEKYTLKPAARERKHSLISSDDDDDRLSKKEKSRSHHRSSSRERDPKYERSRSDRDRRATSREDRIRSERRATSREDRIRSERRGSSRDDRISRERRELSRDDRISRERRGSSRDDRISRERVLHRPSSREAYHDESPIRYVREDDDKYYAPRGNPYKWVPGAPKPRYYPQYYAQKAYGREMPSSAIPRYEEIPEEEPETDDPLTVVAVLRLLCAVEELLGPSLGPKIVDLLAKALALEKVKANSADELLLNDENCVLFETVKEKLKGQLITDMIERNRIKAVKRAIKNIAGVIHMVTERDKNKSTEEKEKEATEKTSTNTVVATTTTATAAPAAPTVAAAALSPEEEKKEMAKKISAALIAQGKTDTTTEELMSLVDYYYREKQRKAKESTSASTSAQNTEEEQTTTAAASSNNQASADATTADGDDSKDSRDEQEEEFGLPQDASNALESLTDTDLQTLLQNFEDLSPEEQQHLHTYMKKLESIEPTRVEKLRKYVNVAFDKQPVVNSNDNSHDSDAAAKRFEPKRTAKPVSSDPYNDMFYDDSEEKNAKKAAVIDTDDDDDDYSFDDMFKAASKNVKENQRETEQKRPSPEVISDEDEPRRHDRFHLGNNSKPATANDEQLSNHSSRESSNSRNNLQDTKSIIENLLGSLQKNIQRTTYSEPVDAPMPDLQGVRPQIQSNVPFYLQQQQQSSSYNNPSYSQANDAKPAPPQFNFMNDFNLGSQQYPNSAAQYPNSFNNRGNSQPSQNFGGGHHLPNIPLNIPSFAQSQPPTQPTQPAQFTSQQAALLQQMQQQFSQQQNRSVNSNHHSNANPYNRFYR